MTNTFPSLGEWEPTHKTLHLYAKTMGVIPRAHAEAHPKWWHISLQVHSDGLRTVDMDLPGGGSFHVFMDLTQHTVEVHKGEEVFKSFDMTAGMTGTQMGDALIGAAAELGLEGEYARDKFEDSGERAYDAASAGAFLQAVNTAYEVFKKHHATLAGEVGPIQLWPHGFDMAFEMFGTKKVSYEEDGKMVDYPSQLNLGFSLGESSHPEPYFYSNPWPFDEDELTAQELPAGASWFTESWQGSLLPYAELAEDPNGAERLYEFAQAVYQAALPTLME